MVKNVYMLGIGGIGMSALARYYRQQGCDVAGYDRSASSLTEALQDEGIHVHFIDDPAWVPEEFAPENTLVVITPAIPKNSRELKYLQEEGFRIVKRSEVLGELAEGKDLVAVAGTHGKTTTSAYCTWIMQQCGLPLHAFVGGVMANHNTNFIPGGDSKLMIAEADEYDRSFLTLKPHIAIVTSTDADHLDVYGSRDNVVRTFGQFVRQIRPGGKLVYRYGIKLELPEHVQCLSYGPEKEADVRITNLVIADGCYTFDLSGAIILQGLKAVYPGRHNVENATAALIATHLVGGKEEGMRKALLTFRGVKRRFETVVSTGQHVYIDDYAHHPAELEACIRSLRELYPGRYIMGIFQPHLYSRTRDFAMEFADSLNLLDEPVLIPLYPAREEPIPGVSSDLILQKLKGTHRHVMSRDEVVAYVQQKQPEVLITMGAGDIDQLVDPLRKVLDPESDEEE
jgi:UDP-N-acetylmuramate--alanine ligase